MAAEPGRRRRCGSRGSPPPAANSSAHPKARTATAPAGDRTACPAGTHRVRAVTSPRTASPDPPTIVMSPRTIRSLINFPEITATASGKQAGSGPATPHLQLMAFRGSGARVLARAIAPGITQRPPERRHALTQPCPARRAQLVTWPKRRWRLTVGGCSSPAKPLRPPPRPIPATNAPAATAIRAYGSEHQSPGRQPVSSSGPGYERCRWDRDIGGDRPGPETSAKATGRGPGGSPGRRAPGVPCPGHPRRSRRRTAHQRRGPARAGQR